MWRSCLSGMPSGEAPSHRILPTAAAQDVLCIYGYTLSIFLPISVLCVLPSNLFRWVSTRASIHTAQDGLSAGRCLLALPSHPTHNQRTLHLVASPRARCAETLLAVAGPHRRWHLCRLPPQQLPRPSGRLFPVWRGGGCSGGDMSAPPRHPLRPHPRGIASARHSRMLDTIAAHHAHLACPSRMPRATQSAR